MTQLTNPPDTLDDPVRPIVARTVAALRQAGVMSIQLHDRRRPEMVQLVLFRDGDEPSTASEGTGISLIFDVDHWAAGPNLPDVYFDYLGDRWTPPARLVEQVTVLLDAQPARRR